MSLNHYRFFSVTQVWIDQMKGIQIYNAAGLGKSWEATAKVAD